MEEVLRRELGTLGMKMDIREKLETDLQKAWNERRKKRSIQTVDIEDGKPTIDIGAFISSLSYTKRPGE